MLSICGYTPEGRTSTVSFILSPTVDTLTSQNHWFPMKMQTFYKHLTNKWFKFV